MNKMDDEKKQNRRVLVAIIILLLCGLIYYFPAQRILAEINYKEYAKQQGVAEEDIVSIRFQKDYKQDGYYVDVKYCSDLNHRYQYHYFLIQNRKNRILFNLMHCDIFDNTNNQLDTWDYEEHGVVYMPIEKDGMK